MKKYLPSSFFALPHRLNLEWKRKYISSFDAQLFSGDKLEILGTNKNKFEKT
jgi:hypothetical protein